MNFTAAQENTLAMASHIFGVSRPTISPGVDASCIAVKWEDGLTLTNIYGTINREGSVTSLVLVVLGANTGDGETNPHGLIASLQEADVAVSEELAAVTA